MFAINEAVFDFEILGEEFLVHLHQFSVVIGYIAA